MTKDDWLDTAALDALRTLQKEGEPDLLEQLFAMFFKMAPERLGKIRRAVAAGDADALKKEAHALKSSCGTLGLKNLFELCKLLEACGDSGKIAESPALLKRLEAEFGRVTQDEVRSRISFRS